MANNVMDGPHDQHGKEARTLDALNNGERGARFHISADKATPKQIEERRQQLASETRTSRMCWR